jgi:transmembrane sensor
MPLACVKITMLMNSEIDPLDPVGLLPKYFAGEASADEIRYIDNWLSASSVNRAEYDAFLKLWNLTPLGSGQEEIDLDYEWQKMEDAIIPARTPRLTLTRILQIAASFILVSALAFLGFKLAGTRSEKAPSGQLASVILPDSSILFLNAGSKITYKKGFGTTHRTLKLTGEAYFEVNKNKSLPFLISAGEAIVRVTGTKFNVRAYRNQEGIRVTVTEGWVMFYDARHAGEETGVSAGETGIYNRNNRIVTRIARQDPNDLAWKTRILDFHNASLSEVAEVLTDTYHKTVVIAPVVEHCTVTVRFENQELDDILGVLKSTLDLELIIRGRRITISGKGC